MARNSYVDETLFGALTRAKSEGTPSPAKCGGASPKRGAACAPASPASPGAIVKGGTVLLSKSQLERMMQVGSSGRARRPLPASPAPVLTARSPNTTAEVAHPDARGAGGAAP